MEALQISIMKKQKRDMQIYWKLHQGPVQAIYMVQVQAEPVQIFQVQQVNRMVQVQLLETDNR